MDQNLLKALGDSSSVSGRESSALVIKDYLKLAGIDSFEDPLHSLVIPGKFEENPLLLTVPVDLPGFFVTYETPERRIHVQPSAPSYPNHMLIGRSFFRDTEEWILCANETPDSAEKNAKSVSYWFDGSDSRTVLSHSPGDAISVRTRCEETENSFEGLFCGTRTLIALLADLCAAQMLPGVTVGFTTRGYVGSRGAKALVQSVNPRFHISLSVIQSDSRSVQILAKSTRLGYSDPWLLRKAESAAEAKSIPIETKTELTAYSRDMLGTASSSEPCPSLALALPVCSEGTDTETVYKESLENFRTFLISLFSEFRDTWRQ